MLSNTSVYEARQLTEILSKNNLGVTAVPLTPLESLAKSNMTADMSMQMGTADLDSFSYLITEGSKSRSADGGVDHDLAQAEVIEMVAGVVARNRDLAKNVVNPICLDVLDRINQAVQTQVARDINNVTVIPDFYREIWNSPILANLVEPFVEVAPEQIELKAVTPDLDATQIAALMVTGVAPLDADVVDLISNSPSDMLSNVYLEVFARLAPNARELSQVLNPYNGVRNEIVTVFLMARRLIDDVPAGVNMPLADYRLYMVRIMAQAGYAINRIQALRERDSATKTLLRSFPTSSVSASASVGEINIIVNGAVYNAWLKEGGSPEIIMGSFITDSETGYENLIAKADSYKSAWSRHLALKTNLVADDRYSRIVAALHQVMVQVITAQEEGNGTPTQNAMLSALKENMQHIHHRDVTSETLMRAVRSVVCKSMFAHTDAETILMGMDRISTQYPEMDMGEVALFSAIDYMTTWVSKLMKVEKY